jgi:hypothetical protein
MEILGCINRGLGPGQHRLEDVLADIRACGILHDIFADAEEIETILVRTKLFVVDGPGEIFVDNDDGSITIGLDYLRRMSDEFLYLDIIHELCHVKQHLQGRNLYDRKKTYVDRETEIEAYLVTVAEARRIGLSDEVIRNYLFVSWITPEEHQRLIRKLDISREIRERDAQV